MNIKMFDAVYDFYKGHYRKIEQREIYKWEAVVHFQNNWDINAGNFPAMLGNALYKTKNLMAAGYYYPREFIVWAAEKEPEKVRRMFQDLYDLSADLKERMERFREGADEILAEHGNEGHNKTYQDYRALMVYLNMRYPDKFYLYKYKMFVDFANLIDYAKLPKAGDIGLLFIFESMCDMVLKKVMSDKGLLKMYEARREKYFDPEYHLLVQDIIYSAKYFRAPEIFDEKMDVPVKKFTLKVKPAEVHLKGVHVDYIEKAKAQKDLGEAGEEFVYQYERSIAKAYHLGKGKQVRRVAKLDGDGLGFDILSYDRHGREIYIEVKTTTGPEEDAIFITANELAMSEMFPEQYRLYRVYDFDVANMDGKIAVREGSLRQLCISAQTYKVNFEK